MKTATIPALRVAPALRQEVENILLEGETLSNFVEQSLRANIVRRMAQQAFLARGMAARDEAKASGEYYSADSVMQELDDMLAQTENRK